MKGVHWFPLKQVFVKTQKGKKERKKGFNLYTYMNIPDERSTITKFARITITFYDAVIDALR